MDKLRVFLTRSNYPESGIKLLREKFDVYCYPFPHPVPEDYLLEHIKGAHALFCRPIDKITKKVLDAAGPQLKIIATMSIGYENIDLEECKTRNIQVCNVASPLYVSVVAEFTIGLLLTVSRRLVEASGAVRRGEWTVPWRYDWLIGRGLVNSCVGIVGMGKIGLAVLKRILPFGVAKVLYYNKHKVVSEAESLGAKSSSFEDLLKESDFVIATCSLTDQSKNLFDSKAFSAMKERAVFINTSRGAVVDQDALIMALRTNQIRAAGIDVMYPEPLPQDHELNTLPNLTITPHLAAAEELVMENISSLAAKNIIEVLEGRHALTPVF